jgi:hypothetical protein
MQSGIKRSSDQSPPPITFPALTEAILIFSFLLNYDLTYEFINNSADAFDAL